MVCVHVCMCAFVRSFFPPLSSQWHWEPSELLHRFEQAKDKNNRAQWKRAQQQGRLSLSPLSVLHASWRPQWPPLLLSLHLLLSLSPPSPPNCYSLQVESFALRLEWGGKQKDTSLLSAAGLFQTHPLPSCFCAHGYFGDTVCWAFLSVVCLAFSWCSTRRGALCSCGPNERLPIIKSLYK